jgi:hypothetical protein
LRNHKTAASIHHASQQPHLQRFVQCAALTNMHAASASQPGCLSSILTCSACPAAAAAVLQLGSIDNSCQFASFNPSVVPLSPDTHRAAGLDNTSPVKFLFNNQQCSDFLLCVSDPALSGGKGCSIHGANAAGANICSMKGSARGDGTYELSLDDPACQGLDLVNCLSVNADGTAMEITQNCQAKIETLTISCTACAAPTGAIAKALQYKPTCDKYSWCGKCECPPPVPPPIPPIRPICSASCKGKSNCDCEDKTWVTKDDRTSCMALDSTSCDGEDTTSCTPSANSTGSTDVECPRYRARTELIFEKQLATGQWVRLNADGTFEFTTTPDVLKCPDPTIVINGRRRASSGRANAAQNGAGVIIDVTCTKGGSCKGRKSGTCAALKQGSCACTKNGGCVPTAGPVKAELELCPVTGGTEFAPCNDWNCGKPSPPHDGYPPKGGDYYPPKGGAYPPKGGMYPPKGGSGKDSKDKY